MLVDFNIVSRGLFSQNQSTETSDGRFFLIKNSSCLIVRVNIEPNIAKIPKVVIIKTRYP